ncbi:acyl-CoA thioester hydrolase, YbgC/YbaW family [Sphaerochaeta pleomorpha str. Grapes]|uniref:Acyl-CoA thioester hydrolase, YbgC/YbaW family n=1 Tax=Sphaerochaeta pleomorpha (strain ATCC BAA-1885 / DSM 22778 / Grapes) TaxID=158190 RepID=G8QYN7_SPHPG|nr:YbgC/FadM family acyl-CoA thioesterase [Sphaerochaeta pleomorpha]AEV28600.1 acyl-CoA thioester hydrolase, YbgC/YbaW family [Sphaerochaeta pleomorpha str. Grapes]
MFCHQIRVYYSDTDCGGIVYHGRYLDFAEHARTELLRVVASSAEDGSQSRLMETENLAFVVKSINIDYAKPGKLDDLLVVETSVIEAKHFSLTFLQIVKRGEETLCTLKVKVASINLKTLRPVALPPWLVPAFEAL